MNNPGTPIFELFKKNSTVKEAFKAYGMPNMALLYTDVVGDKQMQTLGGTMLAAKYYDAAHTFKVLAHKMFPLHGCPDPLDHQPMAKVTSILWGRGHYGESPAEGLNMVAVVASQGHFSKPECKMLDTLACELLEERKAQEAKPTAA